MKLIAFRLSGETRLGHLVGDEVTDLTDGGGPRSVDEVLSGGGHWSRLDEFRKRSRSKLNVAEIEHWLPPVLVPGKAIAVGLNYVDHAAEGAFKVPDYPVLFSRWPTSWVAHRQPLVVPKVSTRLDYEGELVVVVGKRGRHVPESDALDHVAGYSIFNEGSIRDYQMRTHQWTIGKNFDRSGSFGPAFVTADELPSGASGLRIQTRLNGVLMQDASTKDMIFGVARLIALCSEVFELTPGDIIISGTPAGVGVARKPPVFMKPGDCCEVSIEGIGTLSNPVDSED